MTMLLCFLLPLAFEITPDAGVVGLIGLGLMIGTFFLGRTTAAKKDGEAEGKRNAEIEQLKREMVKIWGWKDAQDKEKINTATINEGLKKDIENLTAMVKSLDRDLRTAMGLGGVFHGHAVDVKPHAQI